MNSGNDQKPLYQLVLMALLGAVSAYVLYTLLLTPSTSNRLPLHHVGTKRVVKTFVDASLSSSDPAMTDPVEPVLSVPQVRLPEIADPPVAPPMSNAELASLRREQLPHLDFKHCSGEGGVCTLAENAACWVRWGLGNDWHYQLYPAHTGSLRCNLDTFKADPAFGASKVCQVIC